ncbi:hypothetical protein LV779_07890 [Streptomyces thinghirensis]|nr:hypothetical protein [Streptomyces thinghirensis]
MTVDVLRRPAPAEQRARVAVAVLFFTNGALFANLLPRYPQIKADLGIGNAAYGLAVAAFPGRRHRGRSRGRDTRPPVRLGAGCGRRHAADRGGDPRRRTGGLGGAVRGRAVPGRGGGRVHRCRAERPRPAGAAPLRTLHHQLLPRHLVHRRGHRRVHGRRRDGARRPRGAGTCCSRPWCSRSRRASPCGFCLPGPRDRTGRGARRRGPGAAADAAHGTGAAVRATYSPRSS